MNNGQMDSIQIRLAVQSPLSENKRGIPQKESIDDERMNGVLSYWLIGQKQLNNISSSIIQINKYMGTVKSVANMYSYNEYLYYYINKKDMEKVKEILAIRPNLIKDPLTVHTKVTALNQAAYNNNLKMAEMLIDEYHADVNLPSLKGDTALITAIRRNHVSMVRFLLSKGADPNYIDKTGLKTIEYAILQGLYEISYLLYSKMEDNDLKSAKEYAEIGKKYQYRYVNYEVFLEQLVKMVEPEKARDFLQKKRNLLSDPVIDPRETWKNWFYRNLDFKDPPLVERSSLPEELRPENRRFGKISHFFGRLAMTPISQKPEYRPAQSQMAEQQSKNQLKKIYSEQLEVNSVA